ncbi:MAG: WD40 repeat domain-containing protein, partial [Anaerolineae bacterium]
MVREVLRLLDLSVTTLAGTCEDIIWLEDQCAERGVYAIQADLAAALDLLADECAEAEGRQKAEKRLRGLLRLLQLESHLLRDWQREASPGLLAQRIQYRATMLGMHDMAEWAAARREAHDGPGLMLRWRVGPGMVGLERTLAGHDRPVTGVAVTPDGRRAISSSEDGRIKVWDLASGREELRIAAHLYGVQAMAVAADGRWAVSGGVYDPLEIWDLATGRWVRRLEGSNRLSIGALAVAGPQGRWILAGAMNGTLELWDLVTERETRTLDGHSLPVMALAGLGPDGRRAISASWDGLKVWDLESGREEPRPAGFANCREPLAVTPDGQRVVSGSSGTLKVWDMASGREERTLARPGARAVQSVAVTPDGQHAVSGSGDGTLTVWDLETGLQKARLPGHRDSEVDAVAVTPDGGRVISGALDGTLKVWDISPFLAPTQLGTADAGPTTEVGEAATERYGSRVDSAAVTPDGRRAILWVRPEGALKVLNLATGREDRTLAELGGSLPLMTVVGSGGERIILGTDDGTLKVWNLATGRLECTLIGHTDRVTSVVPMAPDGRRVVSGSQDGTLRVWDLGSGREEHTLVGHSDSVNAVVVTPDGRHAISGSRDGTLKVWDL